MSALLALTRSGGFFVRVMVGLVIGLPWAFLPVPLLIAGLFHVRASC